MKSIEFLKKSADFLKNSLESPKKSFGFLNSNDTLFRQSMMRRVKRVPLEFRKPRDFFVGRWWRATHVCTCGTHTHTHIMCVRLIVCMYVWPHDVWYMYVWYMYERTYMKFQLIHVWTHPGTCTTQVPGFERVTCMCTYMYELKFHECMKCVDCTVKCVMWTSCEHVYPGRYRVKFYFIHVCNSIVPQWQ